MQLAEPALSLGQACAWPSEPVQASSQRLFGPRAVCRLNHGDIWIADTGHHRLLHWPAGAKQGQVLGQDDDNAETRNGGGAAHACSFSTPVGLCAFAERGLALADSWNHRVLIWWEAPTQPHQAADIVLGQPNFTSVQGNRGQQQAAANSLFWPSAVYCDGQRFIVADTGNRRVLIWPTLPQKNGQAASQVLGQPDMHSRDQNGGHDLDAAGMVWPHGIALWQGDLVVADAGANRLMCWQGIPQESAQPCQRILGQTSAAGRLHNQGHAKPSRHSLAMPYALAAWQHYLIVADTANSRLLVWDKNCVEAGAIAVHAQADFDSAGDNRWQPVAADSLCWPYGVYVHDDDVLVADTGNDRVQVWPLKQLLADAG